MTVNRVDPIRVHSFLLGDKRRRALDDLAADAAALRDLDRQMSAIGRQRRAVATRMRETRRRLWPIHLRRGRQPAPDGAPRLPAAAPGASPLWGRRLRAACRAILATDRGPLELSELHARLHERGHLIHSAHPVKALADALGYELELGRVERVRRGVYQLSALRP